MPTSARWGRRGDLYGHPSCRKKALSSLVTGRKRLLSWCHPCSAQKAPSGLLLREGDRARLRARWWSRLPAACRGSFQPGDPSLVRRCERYLLRHCGFSSYDIIPKRGKSQSFSTLCGNKTGGPQGPPVSNHAVKGLVLGLMMSLQSRSPRAPPDGIHRAGTPVISDAAAGSEFRRPSAA